MIQSGRDQEQEGTGQARPLRPFAQPSDFAICRRLHRKHGKTYYFSTQRLPRRYRDRIHALYAFVRVADEWVDNPDGLTPTESAARLTQWRADLIRGVDGVCPEHPVLRAFCDVLRECSIPLEEPLLFLDAMQLDLQKSRYQTFEELRAYMRGSAAAVGVMMCYLLEVPPDPRTLRAAKALGEAMQLTNFLRDVGEDAARGRIYLPLEDLASFEVTETQILHGVFTAEFVNLVRFQSDRARALYAEADGGIAALPPEARKGVRLARVLYSRILNRIEDNGYDVFSRRARTSALEKVVTSLKVLLS